MSFRQTGMRALQRACARDRQEKSKKRGPKDWGGRRQQPRLDAGEEGLRRRAKRNGTRMCNVDTRIRPWCWSVLGEWEERAPFGG